MLDAEILEFVTEVADDVLKSENDLVPAFQLFSQPRKARVFPRLGWPRSRGNPFPSDEQSATTARPPPDANRNLLAQSERPTQSAARKVARLTEHHRRGEDTVR
jgi:hypothetical protein